MKQSEVIQDVQKRLDEVRHNGFTLQVMEEGVRRDGAWWYVPVVAEGEKTPPTDFLYSTYSSIEVDIAEGLKVNVMLVPTLSSRQSA